MRLRNDEDGCRGLSLVKRTMTIYSMKAFPTKVFRKIMPGIEARAGVAVVRVEVEEFYDGRDCLWLITEQGVAVGHLIFPRHAALIIAEARR